MKTLKTLNLTILILSLLTCTTVFGLPNGEKVETGSASFQRPNDSTLNVIAGNGTVINFNSFNIAANETVNFQPADPAMAASTNVLSRVTGPNPTYIAGALNANLNLYISNTNGIHFAPSAQVNVNNLVASTLDISTNNFIRGNYEFEMNQKYSQIVNEGFLNASHNIALIASAVNNTKTGIIVARAGTVNLASGNKVTVSFDMKGLMNVEVNEKTTGRVLDMQGNAVKDAVANAGRIEATNVVMTARTANDIFENAVNQTGIVKATGFANKNGVIRVISNKKIQSSGTLEAKDGKVTVSSEDKVGVRAKLETAGDTEIAAYDDLEIDADITTDSGNLDLIADADLDGVGAFKQAKGTSIRTIGRGDITIQSSGEATIANIIAAGDLIFRKGGVPTTFTQWPDSKISANGSMRIGKDVTINANSTVYEIGKDWRNYGNFIPELSTVRLVSNQEAFVLGSNRFNNFSVTVPGKIVRFDPEATIVIAGTLTLRGAYGRLLVLGSIEPPKQWKILPQGVTDIQYALVGDCINIRGPPLKGLHSDSLGNLTNWDLDPYWTGQGVDNNWSTPDNWDTGTVPLSAAIVTFNGITGTNPNKDSVIDAFFQGTITNLTIDGYTGKITLLRDLTVTGDITIKSGTIVAGSADTFTINASNGSIYIGKNALISINKLDLIAYKNIDMYGTIKGNNIVLKSLNGDTILYSGSLIDVSTNEAGATGGRVELLGKNVLLFGAKVNASGVAGGGTVLIGGDFQGKGTMPNSTNVYVSRDTYIYADATGFGNGGKIIVWANEATQYHGHISVLGGPEGGNGGFVQVSGYKLLEFNGFIDANAPNGSRGTFIIDPNGFSGYAASLATDLWDYEPGEVVTIMGSGWQAGETVSLILHPDKDTLFDVVLTAIADANGNFSNSGFIPQEAHRGAQFVLTGTGQSSGLGAQTKFTDAIKTSVAAGGVWATGATWVGGIAPATTDSVIINSTTAVTLGVAATCAGLTINANCILTIGGYAFTVNGASLITGRINHTSSTGTRAFNGDVTLYSGAIWSETAAAVITVSGSFTNGATTFTASTGVHTFSGAGKTFSGSTTTSIGSVAVTGTYTNNGTLTVATALSGASGTLTNDATGTLNLSGTCSIGSTSGGLTNNGIINRSGTGTTTSTTVTNNLTFNMSGTGTVTAFTNSGTGVLNISNTTVPTFTAITLSAAGNTVNYNAAGTQTVKVTSYYHLTLSGSGIKTCAVVTINGNLTVSGSATTSLTGNPIAIGGNLVVNSSGALPALTVARALTVNGTTDITLGSISFITNTVTNTFIGKVTVNDGNSWSNTAVNCPIVFKGGFSQHGTFNAGSGVYTFNTNNQAFDGGASMPSLTVTGITLTNNGSLTATTALAGVGGTIIQGDNCGLNINCAAASFTLANLNASAIGNNVGYWFAGDQTVRGITYYNLTLGTSGYKTLTNVSTINGSLSLYNSVTASLATNVTVGGNLTVSDTAVLTYGAFSHIFKGSWQIDSSAVAPLVATAGSTISFNTPDTPAETSISGTTSAVLPFVTLNINNNYANGLTCSENITCSGNLTVNGNLSGTGSVTVSGGQVTGDGRINLTAGTFQLNGAGNFGGATDWTFQNLTFGDGVAGNTTSKIGSNKISVNVNLNISLNHTLAAGTGTWNLSWGTGGLNLANIIQISGGGAYTAARDSTGAVYTWGDNTYGQLGIGTSGSGTDKSSPVRVLRGEQAGTTYLANIIQIACGYQHMAAVDGTGAVYTWGYNNTGQLGIGTSGSGTDKSSPVRVLKGEQAGTTYLANITQVACGSTFMAALEKDTGAVYAWGANNNGQLGIGSIVTPKPSPMKVLKGQQTGTTYIANITQIACGYSHMAALDNTHAVYAWGLNNCGQVGIGSIVTPQSSPMKVLRGQQAGTTYLANITQVVCGGNSTAALDNTGAVYTWGYNVDGQLGNGNTGTDQSSPVRVLRGEQAGTTYLANITQIASGYYFMAAIDSTLAVYMWGDNGYGELGIGSVITPKNTPVRVLRGEQAGTTYLANITQMALGDSHTVALEKDTGAVYAWGFNSDGELGIGNIATPKSSPMRVLRGEKPDTALRPLTASGSLICEDSTFEYTGDYAAGKPAGTFSIYITDVTYNNLTIDNSGQGYILEDALAADSFTLTAGTLDVTSSNYGITLTGNWSNSDTFVSGTGTVTFNGGDANINAGGMGAGKGFYKVVINSTGTKTLTSSMLINNVLEVNGGTLGGNYSVTVKGQSATGTGTGVISLTDGTFTLEGTSSPGSFGGAVGSDWTFYDLTFGDGSSVRRTNKYGDNEINVTDVLTVKANHTLDAGTSQWNISWKSYFKSIVMISSGYDHTLALTTLASGGYVFAWGSNSNGQLGDGTTINRLMPVQVLDGEQDSGTYLTGISKIAAGGYHSLALKSDGTAVYAWGYNEYGQLGDGTSGTSADRLTPVIVHNTGGTHGLTGISDISAGGVSSAAVTSVSPNGYVYTWGYGLEGQLGNGSKANSSIPVQVWDGEQDSGTYLRDISQISVGGVHMVALDSSGYVYAWGYAGDGELGDNDLNDSSIPMKVHGGEQGGSFLSGISAISAGDAHTIALTTSGGYVYSWGYNATGQLGNAAETPVQSNTPVQVHGGEKGGSFLAGIASISAGATHNLATASDGYVYSWGENRFGQLGNGSTTNGLVPVKVHGANNVGYVTGVTMVAAGGAQTMMLTQVQYVLSMGYNATGQLGNGTRLSTNSGISVLAGAQSGSSASITPVVIESGGTLTGNASSFDYSQDLYHTTVYVAGGTGANYYDLKFTDNAVATYTLNSNISVFGDITISGAKLSAGSSSITLYGDWISSNGGIFTPGSGTVTLSNATLAQSVTSGGNSFNVIAIANTHAGDVTFVDTLKTNELQATGGVNGVKKIWFSAALIGAPNTINTHFDVNGVPGYKIELAPIALNTPWFLDAPSGTTMNYIKVGYSQQASVRGSITALNSDNLGGNNAYWNISS